MSRNTWNVISLFWNLCAGPCEGMDCLHGVLMHGEGFGRYEENRDEKKEIRIQVRQNVYSVFELCTPLFLTWRMWYTYTMLNPRKKDQERLILTNIFTKTMMTTYMTRTMTQVMTSHAMTTKTERKWEVLSPASSSHDIVIYLCFFFAEVRHVWPT